MRYIRKESSCDTCPLRDRPRVWGQGSLTSKVIVIGESPGSTESSKGMPFCGPAGGVLDGGLAAAGIGRTNVYCGNLISCQPPGNDLDSLEGQEAIDCCRPGLKAELEDLKRHGGRVVVAAGNKPAGYFGVPSGITKHRGSVYQSGGYIIIPTYHPSYINRMRWSKGGSSVVLKWTWVNDLAKARSMAVDGYTVPKERFNLFPTFDDTIRHLSWLSDGPRTIAVDIETTGLTADTGNIVVVGIAWTGEDAISIPFLKQGGGRYWTTTEEIDITHALNATFKSCPQIYQNALFDVRFLRGKGFHVPFENIRDDTLLLHHAISPELPHDLGFIVSIYGDTPYWKADFKARPGKILDMADEDLRRYNARDCAVLHQIVPEMRDDCGKTGTTAIYLSESLRLVQPIIHMMDNGLPFKPSRLAKWKETLEDEKNTLDRHLRELARLPDPFNLSSDDDVRYLLYGETPSKFEKIKALPSKKAGTKIHKALTDLKAIRDGVLPFEAFRQSRRTRSGKASVDKQGLLSLQTKAQNRLASIEKLANQERVAEEKASLEVLLQWLSTYRDYTSTCTLLSTYTRYPIAKDGRVHTSFKIHGTATGRLSSSSPNLQNQPIKRYPALGRCFSPPKGRSLVELDYCSFEAMVLAAEIPDESLWDYLAAGNSFHDRNTTMFFGVAPDDPTWKNARRAAKTVGFGGLFYGGGPKNIHEKVMMDAPDLRITFKALKEAIDRWFDENPLALSWKERIASEVASTMRATHALGRTRIFTGGDVDAAKREGVNFMIQGPAASIINQAMIRIVPLLAGSDMLVCQIHDSLLFECDTARISPLVAMAKEEMEKPVMFRDTLRSFPVECSVGPDWGSLKAYEC